MKRNTIKRSLQKEEDAGYYLFFLFYDQKAQSTIPS